MLSTPDEIDPSFYEQKKNPVEQPEDVKRFAIVLHLTDNIKTGTSQLAERFFSRYT